MPNTVAVEVIATKILEIRGKKVMLGADIAKLYGVKTKRLIEQVWRNRKRFPHDFMYQLTNKEVTILLSQNVILSRKYSDGQSG